MKKRNFGSQYAVSGTSIGPMTKEEAKRYIRRAFGNGKRIPYGTQIWKP